RVALAFGLAALAAGWGPWPAAAAPAPRPPALPIGRAAPLAAPPSAPPPAVAPSAAVQLVASDAAGATLRLDLAGWSVSEPDSSGRRGRGVRGLRIVESPGRPELPYASTLIALPPGSRANATVVSGTLETLDGLRVRIAPKNGFEADRSGLRYHALITPVAP